jgi:Flp pilus assembly protein TadG
MAARRDISVFGRTRATSGNIAIAAALVVPVLLALTGGAIDIGRHVALRAELTNAVESAVLAAAKFQNASDLEELVEGYVASNLSQEGRRLANMETTVEATLALNKRVVKVSARGDMETFFLGMAGMHTLPVAASAEAQVSRSNIEIALVLDISSSMKGQRVVQLRTAATNFINMIFDANDAATTSMSIVPFGGTVNIGPDLFYYLAGGRVAPILDPSATVYTTSTPGGIANNRFRFSTGDNCVEYTLDDFDDSLIPEASRSQVPHFWAFTDFHPWCPHSTSRIFLNSNNRQALIGVINAMSLSDGTGMDVGALWGAKALSPHWRGRLGGDFPDRPSDYDDEDTLKVVVLMTDGAITGQQRIKDHTHTSTHSNKATTGTPGEAGTSKGGNSANQQMLYVQGSASDTASADNAVGRFTRVCNSYRTNGVVVYTIGFDITANSLPDKMLGRCASDPGKYHFVSQLDLAAAFREIATSINALRITG